MALVTECRSGRMSSSSPLLSIPAEGEDMRGWRRTSVGTGGAGRKRRVGAEEDLSSSTRTTIQTPTLPLWPRRGVQWIQRGRPSSDPRLAAAVESQRIFAVTPREPSARLSATEFRTRSEPPMRSRKRDWRIPGTRREGEVNKMRSEG